MGDAFDSLALGGEERALSIRGLHLAAVIILTCAACITPIELFILEVWSSHGFSSLLLFVVARSHGRAPPAPSLCRLERLRALLC